MLRTLKGRRKRHVKALLYSFVFIIASSLLVAAMPRSIDGSLKGRSLRLAAPTAVHLNKFEAFHINDVISLEWRSGYELDNLGYNIYREQVDGQRVRLNPGMIAGSALQAGQGVALGAGNSYAWRDKLATDGQSQTASYWLESIDLNGESLWYGPIYAKVGDAHAALPEQSRLLSDYAVEPARAKQREWPAKISSAVGGQVKYGGFVKNNAGSLIAGAQQQQDSAPQFSPELDQQWVIAAQNAVKLSVNHDGWQKVSRAELLAAGLSHTARLSNLQLYRNGVEQAMVVNDDGSIEFYGQAINTIYTDTQVYFLIAAGTQGKRVAVSSAGPFDPNVQSSGFASTIERRDRSIRFAALLNGDGENFFGGSIPSPPFLMHQTLQVTALDSTQAQTLLEIGVQGLSQQAHQVKVQLNGTDVGVINLNNRANVVAQFNISTSLLRANKNDVALSAIGGGGDVSLIDFARLTYPRRYEAAGNRLLFSAQAGQAVKVGGFTSNAIRVLDITDAANVKELTVSPQVVSGQFAFTLPAAAAARTLLAYAGSASLDHPQDISRNEASGWHVASNAADMIILTHKDFRQSLEPLRALRQSQGLLTVIVDVEDIYDEFSYGAHSPQALKDFLQRAKTLWQTAPRYLLLVGDGTYDPRNYLGYGDVDYMPIRMVDAYFSEAASDDAFVDFDNNGLPELAVGRFPVRTAQEATTIINKIMTYEMASAGDTQQRGAVMVSDQPDSYDFVSFTNQVRASLPQSMNVQMINREDGDTATIHAQIMTAINQGKGVVNFLGHGSVGVWTGAPLLSVTDAQNMTNGQQLSVFVMMTCLNGSFGELGTDSLGEAVIKAPSGGAVSAWTSSGLTVPYGQVDVSKRLYELLFTGQAQRIGDATKDAKQGTNDPDVRRLSILFGDPAMRFR